MTARAVLIGAETYGLSGCDADVALFDDALRRRGFDTTCLIGGRAGRASILEALDDLVAQTGPGDAAVLYYSGHGGRLVRPDADDRKAAGRSPFFQFLVPTDMEQSAPGDFRGVLSEELTLVQRRLVDAFGGSAVNATTILDCCHSGYMARNLQARSRSVDLSGAESRMFTVRGVLDHVRALPPEADVPAGSTNADVVRLVACQTEQSAFELPAVRGGTHGVFTDALASVLDEIGDAAVSWAIVGDLVRRRVRAVVPEQRPDVEGPGHRVVFGSEVADDVVALPLAEVDGRVAVLAAALLGIHVGDEIRLLAPGGDEDERRVVVESLRDGAAVLDVDLADLARRPGGIESLIALPGRLSVPPAEVAVTDGAGADDLRAAVEASPRLTVGETHPLAALRSSPEGWHIDDAVGSPWRSEPLPADAADEIVDVIEAIAVGHRLLDLPDGSGPHRLDPDVEILFHKVVDGGPHDLGLHGERVVIGTPITLTLRNTATEERFVWLFDVGVSGRSSLVTSAGASGTRVGPAGDEDDTLDIWRADGEPLFWPADVPLDPNGRPETFVVITADRRNDLSGLASRQPAPRSARRSPLDLLLDEVRVGSREVAPASGATEGDALRYRLDRVEFVLLPS